MREHPCERRQETVAGELPSSTEQSLEAGAQSQKVPFFSPVAKDANKSSTHRKGKQRPGSSHRRPVQGKWGCVCKFITCESSQPYRNTAAQRPGVGDFEHLQLSTQRILRSPHRLRYQQYRSQHSRDGPVSLRMALEQSIGTQPRRSWWPYALVRS